MDSGCIGKNIHGRSRAMPIGLLAMIFGYLSISDHIQKIDKLSKRPRLTLIDPYYQRKFFSQDRKVVIRMNQYQECYRDVQIPSYLMKLAS